MTQALPDGPQQSRADNYQAENSDGLGTSITGRLYIHYAMLLWLFLQLQSCFMPQCEAGAAEPMPILTMTIHLRKVLLIFHGDTANYTCWNNYSDPDVHKDLSVTVIYHSLIPCWF